MSETHMYLWRSLNLGGSLLYLNAVAETLHCVFGCSVPVNGWNVYAEFALHLQWIKACLSQWINTILMSHHTVSWDRGRTGKKSGGTGQKGGGTG